MSSLSKKRLTVYPNGVAGFLVDDNSEIKTANYTIASTTDLAKTFLFDLDGVFATLPGISVGRIYTVVNMAEDGTASLSLSPNANDGITYSGLSDDNKDLINTKATAKKGDFVTVASLDGVVAWQVVAIRGIWAKQP